MVICFLSAGFAKLKCKLISQVKDTYRKKKDINSRKVGNKMFDVLSF